MPHKNKIWIAIALLLSAAALVMNILLNETPAEQPTAGVVEQAVQAGDAP